MASTGQTINDRINAMRYALAGQGLARTVCKATTEEVLAPKKKHLEYLLACTEEPNISIPELANLLIERSQHTSWAVVFKSLITIHQLMNYGNERFTQYLATSNHSFELNDFMDRTTPQGYNMSAFVRRYAKYINDKISSYKMLAIDLCKVKPGKDNALRVMNMENLSKTLPIVHQQFDSLLDFNVETKDLNNGIVMAAFKLLYKDLNRIFAAYQEAIINLVERYFKLSRKKAREALQMYKKYLDRMDKVANFFKVVESVGLDKSEMSDTSKLTSLLGVLEEHLAQLEAKKRGTTPASPNEEEACAESTGKENVSPQEDNSATTSRQTTTDVKEEPRVDVETKQKAKDEHEKLSTSSASEQASVAPRKQPPTRPSPIVSPKVSPSTASKANPAAKNTTTEKKPPPERPAKPPSRPPPPSSAEKVNPEVATAAAAAASSQTRASLASTPASSSPPPPHPPPPAHPPQPRASHAEQNQQATAANEQHPSQNNDSNAQDRTDEDTTTRSCTGENGTVGDSVEGQATSHINSLASDDSAAASLPTCAANQVEEVQVDEAAQVQNDEESAGLNHVIVPNNIHGNENGQEDGVILEEEIAQPPPPPPLQDDEMQRQQQQQDQVDHNADTPNDHNENHNINNDVGEAEQVNEEQPERVDEDS